MQPIVQRRQLLIALQQQILPCLQKNDHWRIVLAEPPFQLPPEINIRFHNGKPLNTKQAQRTNTLASVMSAWPNAQVHNNSVPFMGFVLKGAMDGASALPLQWPGNTAEY